MDFGRKNFIFRRDENLGILENCVQSGGKFKRKKVFKSENSMESNKVFLGGKIPWF